MNLLRLGLCVVFFALSSCGKFTNENSTKESSAPSSEKSSSTDLTLATEVCVDEKASAFVSLVGDEQKKCQVTWYAPLNIYPYGVSGPYKSKSECEIKKGYFTGACYWKCSCGKSGY